MISNTEAFMVLAACVPYGFYVTTKVRKYIAKVQFVHDTQDAYLVEWSAQFSKHCEQLEMAYKHHVNTKPILERMAREKYELNHKWRRV